LQTGGGFGTNHALTSSMVLNPAALARGGVLHFMRHERMAIGVAPRNNDYRKVRRGMNTARTSRVIFG
jgi:hypothetical protein